MNGKFDTFDQRLDRLFERIREGKAEAEDIAELEQDMLADPELRRRYRSRVRMEESLSTAFEELTEMILPFETSDTRPWPFRAAVAVAGLAALIAVLAVWQRPSADGPQNTVAMLESRSADIWELPPFFDKDSRVGSGEIRLISGTARFRFDSGAIVSLEGPASLMIETSMKARLTNGKALVEVHNEKAQGFVLELPHGKAIDLGTRFSTIVGQSGATCEVLEGSVLIQHTASGSEELLDQGQVVAMTGEGFQALNYRPSSSFAPQVREPLVFRSKKETTTVFMSSTGIPSKQSRSSFVDGSMLLVKMEPDSMAQRRALFNIDLEDVRVKEIEEATLNLNLVPSGIGFADYLPETVTFAIYGISDESQEDWSVADPRWDMMPGCAAGDPDILDTKEVTLLGKFEIERGRQRGKCVIGTDELRDFLRRDTTGVAGFLIVRETYGTGNYSLVHAFASSRHPEASGPSLELLLTDRK